MVVHKCIITINDKPDSKNNILYTILLQGEPIIGNKTIYSEFIYKMNDTFCFKIDNDDKGCSLSSVGIARLLSESKKVIKYTETNKMSLQSLIHYFKINISPIIEDTFGCSYIIYTGEDIPLGTVNYAEACVMSINNLKKCRLKFVKDSGKTDDTFDTLIIEFGSDGDISNIRQYGNNCIDLNGISFISIFNELSDIIRDSNKSEHDMVTCLRDKFDIHGIARKIKVYIDRWD